MMGVDSAGMLCSAYDIGWISEPDNKLVVMPDDADVGQPCPADPPKVRSVERSCVALMRLHSDGQPAGALDPACTLAMGGGSRGAEAYGRMPCCA